MSRGSAVLRWMSQTMCVGVSLLWGAASAVFGQTDDNAEPLAWSWTKTEQNGLNFLETQIKRGSDGYWIHKGNRYTVRSGVSAGVTAATARYVERMLEVLPRVFGFPMLMGQQELQVTVHPSAEDVVAAGGKRGKSSFRKVSKGASGSSVAEIHLCAMEGDELPRELMNTVNLRLLQHETVLALLELGAGRRELSVFMSEGCAAYFESWDLREQMPKRFSRMAMSPRQKQLKALQQTLHEAQQFCPDLLAIYAEPRESFFGESTTLHLAWAESFVDFLLSSGQRFSLLSALLYNDALSNRQGGDAMWLAPLKTLASLESAWHDHLCRIVADTLYVQKIAIPVTGTPARIPSVTHLDRYGTDPLIAVCPGLKEDYDIAWYEANTRSIRVLKCNPDNSKAGEIVPEFLTGRGSLLGFSRIPGKDFYVAGYSKDNSFGNRNCEYWVGAFNAEGRQLFNTRIFGEKNSDDLHSKGYPGAAGSARIIYNEATGNFGVYVSHSMKWPDKVRHQGGYFSLLTPAGKNSTVNGWYVSHNFDQRLVVAQGDFYLLAHGDAYPRALVFSKWSGSGKRAFEMHYHAIPGKHGDNTTSCQTGGLVVLDKRGSVVVFASANERKSHDVCVVLVDPAGKEVRRKWLTEYPSGKKGSYPRIAFYGKNALLVAWAEFSNEGVVLRYAVLDESIERIQKQSSALAMEISTCYDMVNLSDGSVLWALPGTGENINVCRIDLPDKMYGLLRERLAKETAKLAAIRLTPRRGVTEQLDAALLKKLATLSQAGTLPPGGMRLSKSSAVIKLAAAEASGELSFEAQAGGTRAVLQFSELSLADKAVIACALVSQEPTNQALLGVAGYYLTCAGQKGTARMYFARAGREVTTKFNRYFTQQ